MAFQLTGKLKALGQTEQKSDSFKLRKFVVTAEGDTQYPQQIEFQATNDKCDILNTFAVGSDVTVSFNLRGREWTSPQGEVKYFTTLDAWRIEAAAANAGAPSVNAPIPQNQVPVNIVSPGSDDLPF